MLSWNLSWTVRLTQSWRKLRAAGHGSTLSDWGGKLHGFGQTVAHKLVATNFITVLLYKLHLSERT